MSRTVLGIDLACANWSSIGTATLSFESRGKPRWLEAETDVIEWPADPLTVESLGRVLTHFIRENNISAVSIDGPQGWRDPDAEGRPGVGRWCEYEAATPGKVGPYQVCYPSTWSRWIDFSIKLFDHLVVEEGFVLANDVSGRVDVADTQGQSDVLVLESFPTSIWSTSGLVPLPGHQRASPDVVREFAGNLVKRYGLPRGALTDQHDHLQAIVAALPAAALLGGPCRAVPRGEAARLRDGTQVTPRHRIEGIIWDASPLEEVADTPAPIPTPSPISPPPGVTGANPILPDERDPRGERVLERGVALFRGLAVLANQGMPTGIGYGQFVTWLHEARSFKHVAGRPYLPSDSAHVIQLAVEVTEAAGGRIKVTSGPVSIDAGMDTFIWGSDPPFDRSAKAWQSSVSVPPYTREDWKRIFPDGRRRLITSSDLHRLSSGGGG